MSHIKRAAITIEEEKEEVDTGVDNKLELEMYLAKH